jgi:flagellar hook protein FlgE
VHRPIFKMPLATFRNPNGLEARRGNAYAPSNASGALSLLDAGTGGAGQVAANALEGSTM